MKTTPKLPTRLKTSESKASLEEAEADLGVPDPPPDEAHALLRGVAPEPDREIVAEGDASGGARP